MPRHADVCVLAGAHAGTLQWARRPPSGIAGSVVVLLGSPGVAWIAWHRRSGRCCSVSYRSKCRGHAARLHHHRQRKSGQMSRPAVGLPFRRRSETRTCRRTHSETISWHTSGEAHRQTTCHHCIAVKDRQLASDDSAQLSYVVHASNSASWSACRATADQSPMRSLAALCMRNL
jgi:hypothetical protein